MDLTKLTDEELLALKEGRYDALSDESLRALSGKKQYAPSVEEMQEAKAAVEPSTGEALAGGFVEGIPFLKDAVSAYDGISEAMEDENFSFEKAYSNYKEQLDDTNRDLKNAQEQAPVAFAGGEIGATAASLAAGGAALKGAGAASTLTPLGINVASGVGVGAAQQLSRSEDRGLTDVAVGGTIGLASEIGGHYLMKGVKQGGRYLLDKGEDVGARAVKKLLGIGNVTSKKQLFKHLKRTKQKESEFLNNILTQKMKNSDELVVNFSDKPERMLDKIKLHKSDIGERIGKSYKEIDATHKVEVDIQSLKNSLTDDVVSPFWASDDPGMNKIGDDLAEYIDKIGSSRASIKKEFTNDGPKMIEEWTQDPSWTLSRVHKLQKDIRKRIETIYKKNGLDMNASKEQQRQVATSLGKHMDEVLDTVSSEADDVIGKIKKDRIAFGNMSTIEDSIESEMFRSKDDPVSLVKEALGIKSLVISGAATGVMGPAGLVAGPALNRVINSPKTPLYLSQGLKAVGTAVGAAPTGKIATKLNSAALMNIKLFRNTLYGTIADINLTQSPLPRTAEAAIARQDDLRHLIKDQQPSMLPVFERAMESGDPGQIGMILDRASKIEGASKYFQKGIGFDGIVYNQEDKMILESQLKGADIPGAQRIQMLNALRKNGIVPNMEEIVRPAPKTHIPRTKKMHDY